MTALLLAAPSLASPLVMDEYVQLLRFRDAQSPTGRSFLSTAFVFAEASGRAHEQEHGLGAWWSAPDLKIALFRPLAAVTQAIDFSLWPDKPTLMHAHTLLWFAALLAAVQALYRRFMAPADKVTR